MKLTGLTRTRVAALVAVGALGLSACGTSDADTSEKASGNAEDASTVEVTDMAGTDHTVPAAPSSVVATDNRVFRTLAQWDVELSAALGTYIKQLCKKFKVRDNKLHIDLIEAAPRILPRMSEKASKKVEARLKKLGVHVQTGKAVESATADDLVISGNRVDSRTVIWTSGVANNPFYANNASHFSLAKNGRVEVDEYMRAGKNLYVIGDNASTPYSGLAQTALHDALFVSNNLKRRAKKQSPKKYKAVMPPVVVPVGEGWAVFEWHGVTISGRAASALRRAADFIGYRDILPLGHALGVWRASYELEDDYF